MRVAALVFAAALPLQGCSTSAGEPVPGARRTDTFPNLNIRPKVAAPQFTDAEARASKAELDTRRETIESESRERPPSNAEELRRLAEARRRNNPDQPAQP